MPRTEQEYKAAREIYAELAIDTDQAIETLASIPLSIHCWQGDDVIGFDGATSLSGGILSTGSYPGRARNAEELRSDAAFAFSLIPGKKRFNLHAMYAETGGAKVDRCDLEPSYYEGWIEWAKQQHIGLDFNPTFFSHPLAESGWTLAHADNNIRDFWIRHGKASRRIAQSIADALKDHVVNNLWVPDGYKDMPADRLGPRLRLKESLDAIYSRKTAKRPSARQRRIQALRYRIRSLRGRFSRVLSRLCISESHWSMLRYGPLPPHRKRSGQNFFDSSLCTLSDPPLEQRIALGLRSHSHLE